MAKGVAPEIDGGDSLDHHAVHGHFLERAEVDELDAEREVLEPGGAVTHGQDLVAKLLGLCEHEVAAVGQRVGVDQEECVPWDLV